MVADSQTNDLKSVLENRCLPALFGRWAYVSLEQVLRWLSDHGVSGDSRTVTKYLSNLVLKGQLWRAGRGWHSNLPDRYDLDHRPVWPVVKVLRAEYPNLETSCWSTEQLRRHVHHLLSSFVTFVHVERGFENDVAELLEQ
jgi:hypothetical protein